MTTTELIEPITIDTNRKTILPIKHQDLWKMYKIHEQSIWHANEVRLDKDKSDWESLTDNERFFLKRVLAFFASSDMIVSENLCTRFMREIKCVEAQVYYGFQNMMENIHSEVYSNIIDTYVKDVKEKDELFNAVERLPFVKKKAQWAKKWIDGDQPLSERIVAFAIIEGSKLPGLAKANDFIARDEAIHVQFATILYNNYIVNKMDEARFQEIMTEAVNLEVEFITEALPCRLIGMNSTLMIQYIKYCADRLATQLHYNIIYDVEQPFSFMDRICLREKSNFFEDDASSYKKKGIENITNAYDDL